MTEMNNSKYATWKYASQKHGAWDLEIWDLGLGNPDSRKALKINQR